MRLLTEATPDYDSEFEAIRQVATKLGISGDAMRKWRRSSESANGANFADALRTFVSDSSTVRVSGACRTATSQAVFNYNPESRLLLVLELELDLDLDLDRGLLAAYQMRTTQLAAVMEKGFLW